MIDKASLLDLTVPEMTALTGGLRVLGANAGGSSHGVLTDREGELSNDFFVNLLDMGVEWTASTEFPGVYVATDRETGDRRWTATPVDLMFGSSSELRSISEVYGADDGEASSSVILLRHGPRSCSLTALILRRSVLKVRSRTADRQPLN